MVTLPSVRRGRSLSPFRRFTDVESELARWMRGEMPRFFESAEEFGWCPSVDVADADGEFLLTAELPGVDPDHVEVDVEDGVLTLKGEKREEKKEETKDYRVYERQFGSFERRFSLPTSVDAEGVNAEFSNGLLKVHMPKTKQAKGRKIEIEAES